MRIKLFDFTYQNVIREKIYRAVKDVLDSGVYVGGKNIEKFEEEFKRYIGTKHCIFLSNGTDALELALLAIGIKPGDEVILPASTFIATAEAVVTVGAKPVFADIDDKNYTLSPESLESKITEKTKAVIPVHLYGHPADMDRISDICKKNNIRIIEDCCQSHGAKYKGKKVGSLSDAGVFSFYPTKNLGAIGNAGALTTDNSEIAEKVRLLKDHGRMKNNKYEHKISASNKNPDEIQAAVLLVKLKYLDIWNEERRKIAEKYRELIKKRRHCLPHEEDWAYHVYHLFVTRVNKKERDKIKNRLSEKGIESREYYPKPLHLMQAFANLGYKKGDLPSAESLSEECLALPLYPGLKYKHLKFIAQEFD